MAKQTTKTTLSVRQPWAWLLVHGYKDIENRRWSTNFRGRCLIHAGKTFDRAGYERVKRDFNIIDMPQPDEFELGGIVGWVEIEDCVTRSGSKWFSGPYGFKIRRAGTLPFFPARGKLKFFDLDDSIFLRLDVTPPALIERGSRKASVQVSITGTGRYPLAGLRLRGKTSPGQLGTVSGLADTDESGRSAGEWQAGRTAGDGWLVVESQFGEGRAAIELFTPELQVTVRPAVLTAGSGAAASVVVRVKDADGNPVQGIPLYGKTVPASLGEVSGLRGAMDETIASSTDTGRNLPDTDVNGVSMGLWWAGWQPGRGRLVVEAIDSGHRAEAAIRLVPEPTDPNGPEPPEPPEIPDPVSPPEDPEPPGKPGTKPGGTDPPTSKGKGRKDDRKRPRRPKDDDDDDDDDTQDSTGEKGGREGEHDGERDDGSQGSTGSRSPHLGTQRSESGGSKGGRPGRRGPGHKESGSGG